MDTAIKRKRTRQIRIGDILMGGEAPITVQSMTNTDTRNIPATIDQIKGLEEAGCDIARLAIVDREAAEAIKPIKQAARIPLVADIHFDYQLALICLKNGIDKVRINPGNIGDRERVRAVVEAARERNVPIRIGVNAGSLEKHILEKYGGPTPQGMVESALGHISILRELKFEDIAVSLKASSVLMTIQAYRLMSEAADYPLHIGVTEAGTIRAGSIKSSVGIGVLLAEGIGDTIRVSLTGDPVEEVGVGKEILRSLGYIQEGIEFIACPTCGRCQIDLITIANKVEARLKKFPGNLKVAVMGCAVNGPGEAREADIGIAGGKGEVLLFKKGEIVRKIPQEQAVEELYQEIVKMK